MSCGCHNVTALQTKTENGWPKKVSRFSLQGYEKEIYYSMKSVTKTTHPATHFVAFHDRVAIVADVA